MMWLPKCVTSQVCKRVNRRVVRVVVMTLLVMAWLVTTFLRAEAKDLNGVLARGLGVAALSFTPDVAAQIAPALSGAVGQAVHAAAAH